MRWTPEQLARDAGGTLERRGQRDIEGVFIDTRTPRRDALFVPLIAARDGHDFVDQAVLGGAQAVLWQRGRPLPAAVPTVVVVEDTLEALTQLARRRRERFDGPVVSVSGSNGKTTTRSMISAVLERAVAPVLSTRGNLNNHLGVPLTLLGEPHEPASMVIELGMSAPGENEHLASIVRAGVHVVTSIALEHLEYMKTIEAIAAAEAEPFACLPRGGLAVIPSDEPRLEPYLPSEGQGVEVWRCGPEASAQVRLLEVHQRERTEAVVAIRGEAPIRFRLALFGLHNARNACMALAVGRFLGVSSHAMVEALERVQPVGDRSRLVAYGEHVVIADCYNANPGSVTAALRSLAGIEGRTGPKIAVVGDMLELGPQEASLHADVGTDAAALGLDALITVGSRAAQAAQAALRDGLDAVALDDDVEAVVEAIERRLKGKPPGAVLVKGSRGMKLERVVERLLSSAQRPPYE